MALFAALGNEDPGGEAFEKLFERLADMKGMCRFFVNLCNVFHVLSV